MSMRPKLWMSWSSGKDSAFALQELLSPLFSGPIPVQVGTPLERDGFVFCDVRVCS